MAHAYASPHARRVYDRVNEMVTAAVKCQSTAANAVGAADDTPSGDTTGALHSIEHWMRLEEEMLGVLDGFLAARQTVQAAIRETREHLH